MFKPSRSQVCSKSCLSAGLGGSYFNMLENMLSYDLHRFSIFCRHTHMVDHDSA